MTQTALAVLLTLAGVAAVFLLYQAYRAVAGIVESARRTADALAANTGEIRQLRAVMEQMWQTLAPAAVEMKTHMAGIPNLLQGVTVICNAQLEILQAQRAKPQHPFGKPNGPLPPRDVTQANTEWDVQQMMRAENVSRDEALMRLNPTNDSSVWDGDQMFKGWR